MDKTKKAHILDRSESDCFCDERRTGGDSAELRPRQWPSPPARGWGQLWTDMQWVSGSSGRLSVSLMGGRSASGGESRCGNEGMAKGKKTGGPQLLPHRPGKKWGFEVSILKGKEKRSNT